jgi:Xaa-Pro aminopeptidase
MRHGVGKTSDKQKRIHNIVRETQNTAINIIKPGIEVAQIYNRAEVTMKNTATLNVLWHTSNMVLSMLDMELA